MMMALPVITSRTQIQKIPTIALNVRKVLSGGTDGDFYTVPDNKKAIITGTAVCTGTGAAATTNLRAAGVTIASWIASGGATNNVQIFVMKENITFPFTVQLDAGEILQYTQNTGTNSEMNINAEILETPA